MTNNVSVNTFSLFTNFIHVKNLFDDIFSDGKKRVFVTSKFYLFTKWYTNELS
jgi:hypothetical protein